MASRYGLSYTGIARLDLRNAKLWLTQPGSGRRGHERYAALNRAVLDLRDHYNRWPLGDFDGVHERPAHGYRVYFKVDETAKEVIVLRVFSPFQNRSQL